jgi:C4-dicarboxylate transporter, DctQ subunit
VFKKIFEKIEFWINIVGVAFIAMIMFMIPINVIYRFIVGKSILGVYELSELFLIVVASFTYSYTQYRRGHIRMDMVVEKMHGKTLHITEIVALVLCFAISIIICVMSAQQARLAMEVGESAPLVSYPVWAFKMLIPFGFLALSIRLFIQIIEEGRLLVIHKKWAAPLKGTTLSEEN